MESRKWKIRGNQNCSVPRCNSVRYKCPHLSFHRFPKDKVQAKLWKIKLRIGKKVGSSASVCSLHFTPSDFHPQAHTIRRACLRNGAVPSQNLPVRLSDKACASDVRQERRQKRESLAATQAQQCEWFQSLWSSDTEQPLATRMSRPLSELEPEASSTVMCQQAEEGGRKADASIQVSTLELMKQKSIIDLINTEQKLSEATGIPSFTLLKTLTTLCEEKSQSATEDMTADILMTLIKAKHAVPFTLLSILFGVSKPTAARKFKRTIQLLASILSLAIRWPSVSEVRSNMPHCFAKFRNTRVVVDCTEIPLNRAKCLTCRQLTYSQYKGQHTLKVMIGVSPAGLVTFVSKIYGGRASDKAIFEQSGLADMLEPSVDAVMADKGFLIEEACERMCVQLYRPPFLRAQKQFSRGDALFCAEITRARVHVERVIGRMKMLAMMSKPLHNQLLPSFEAVLTVAAGLTNLATPVLSDIRF